jgi:hypothetical protein
LIGAFIVTVVVITAVVIVLVYEFTGSWSGGAAAGGISGVVTVALYPVIFRASGTRNDP